ncbi:DEAD/DEAH box helicase [Candidatus Accumulibacter sp. ACC007]|uniref:DEAD/DEAH box helicase n=1 Tax=Candidatus Accumulibacter sp. ACC007 TaxID=2823333 RepID=UPI0025BECC4C|nr:DEAD/DEAH box helicase [Candidatus Accumulibacter sp. ACC007]
MSRLSEGCRVTHPRHGPGEVLFDRGETVVARFSHGLEEVKSTELVRVLALSSAIELGEDSPADTTVLRAQAAAIRSVNDAWGVFSRSRIALLPHQLWVCHKALRQWPIRLLIADDVGMGKTVEAGLVLWPLLAKGAIKRLLVLTPAKLVEQWQLRLRQMFDIRLAIYTTDADTPRSDFWNTQDRVVASLPTLRADNNGRHERLLSAPEWDMVIVDEAHHLNADENGSKTLGLQLLENMEALGKISSCIFFTGTPHRGKDYGFWSLMRVLDPQIFDPSKLTSSMLAELPRYLIRNAKQRATDMSGRRLFQPVKQYPETFDYTPEESSFYTLMSSFILAGKAYASSLTKAQRGQVMLVLIALQKLASSSVAAVRSALETRQMRLRGLATKYRIELAEETEDPDSDEMERAVWEWSRSDRQGRILLMEDEAAHLNDLIDAAHAVKVETRIQRVIEIIGTRFFGRRVLLFTEYKRTQALLMSALIERFGDACVGFINGDNRLDGVTLPDGQVISKSGRREDVCDAFNSGGIRFLISTEAGGEGIDLQHRCSALIHVDLPWNPMRLHQRVGRLNRYGQTQTVEVVSLRNPDTVESMIWEKLEEKIGNIMSALGSAMDEPEDLLQLVLGMASPGFFEELFVGATNVPKERLASWFDSQTLTFGGAPAIDTIKTLVGHAQSFDLSGLKNVPPLDLPDLLPFFQAALGHNGRRAKVENGLLSFKTPDKWLDHPAIKRDYKNMSFDRGSNVSGEGGLIGVGHPMVNRALDQADRLVAVLSYVYGLGTPLLLLLASDRVTDGGAYVRRAAMGVVQESAGLKVIRDWEVLRLLNRLESPRMAVDKTAIESKQIESWVQEAKLAATEHLPQLDLPFSVPELTELLLLWPVKADFEVGVGAS